MDERKIEHFVTVASELSFTRAAQLLFATQSSVSAAVSSLEKELGVQLLHRSTRSVDLTEAGRTFLPQARALLHSMDHARASVDAHAAGLRGTLSIGTLSHLATVNVPELVAAFHHRYPNVGLRVRNSPRGAIGLSDEILAGTLDLAFLGSTWTAPGLHLQPLRRFSLGVLVADDHPLARRDTLDLADLAGESFIDLPGDHRQRQIIDSLFARQGLPRTVIVEVMDITTVPGYVASGLGMAIVPTSFDRALGLPVTAIPLRDADFTWVLSVATADRRAPTRAAKAFLDMVPEFVDETAMF